MGETGEEPVRFRLLVGIFALAAAGAGLIAFVGLIFGPPFLASLGAEKIPMAPSTALFFSLYGAAIFLRTYLPANRALRRMSLAINAVGAGLALLLLFLSYHQVYLRVEKLGISVSGTVAGAPVGHMSPLTAFCFLLSSMSFLASFSGFSGRTGRKAVAFWSAGLLVATCIALLLAYLYGTPMLYGSSFIPPAATTSLAFLALGIALLVSAVSGERSSREMDLKEMRFSYFLILLFLILTVVIVSAGYFRYRKYERRYRAGVERQLSAIANLRAGEIARWREERLADAAVYFRNDDFYGLVGRYLQSPSNSEAGEKLETWLSKLQAAYHYDRVLLLDVRGMVRMSDPVSSEPIAPHLARAASGVLISRKVTFLDFYRDSPDGPVSLAVLVPILEQQHGGRSLGVLVLRINPESYLYPLIRSWPADSQTAETLLVRREGRYVRFLSELRFRKNTSLNLKFPLSRRDFPAARAVLGKEGIVEGRDYRGAPVIASMRAVPDSPWFLVAHMDISEVYAPLRERLWIMIILVGSLLGGTGAAIGMVWRQRQSRFYREIYEAAEALRASEARYRSTLDNMLEGCQIIGFDWRYLYVNKETARQGRRTREELLGRKMTDLYPGIESTEMFAALKRCMEKRSSSTLENEFTYPDGATAWFYLKIQPVPEGLVILSADITDQKQAEKLELHLNALIRAIRKVNQLITKERDRNRLIQGACEELVATRGFHSAWIALMNSSGKEVEMVESGLGENFRPLRELIEGGRPPQCIRKALSQEEVVITTDTSIDCPDCPLDPFYKGNASFCVRIEHGGKVYGIFSVSLPQRLAFDREEQTLFQEVGNDIAFGLHNIEQEEKRSEMIKELSYSEARYRVLFEGTVEGILIVDIGSKKFKYGNPAICKMLGYAEDELKRMGVEDIHPKEDLDWVLSEFEAAAKQESGQGRNIPCLRKDGTIIFADLNSTQTLIDGIPCAVAFVTDVTERKKFDDALRESEERFKTLFEYAPDAYYLHDFEGRFIDGNRAAEELTGYSKEELVGKSFTELTLLSPEGIRKAADFLRKNVGGLPTGPDELLVNRKDGKQVSIEIRTYPLAIGGQDMVLGIARDISERKSLEQQLIQSQKMEAVGRLAGGIAHDFNNLLTSIIGNADLSLTTLDGDNALRQSFEEIRKAGQRAASLTGQLLAFSRRQVLQPRVLDLNRVVADMDRMLGRLIGDDIDLETVLAPDLGQAKVDPGQIEQVIMNLAVNARDSMPRGGKITIETANAYLEEGQAHRRQITEPGPYVMLAVSDTGVGMGKEVLSHLFEPFFTTKEKGKGTGLGLATVYGIVKQSGGYILVYSEPGKGSTFKIYLPRVEEKIDQMREEHIGSEGLTGSETVLVAEDDEMVRNLTRSILRRYGYRVLEARNGEEAVKVSREHKGPIHLTLTDVVMPGMSGRELWEKLRGERPKMKVLFMSGYMDDAIVHHGILEPKTQFIHKPFSPEALARKIKEALGGD